MYRIVAHTQVWENYSDDPDRPRWKPKGGLEYLLGRFTLPELMSHINAPRFQARVTELADKAVSRKNDMVDEYLIDWEILADGEHTGSERDQLEYEGRIRYHPINRAIAL